MTMKKPIVYINGKVVGVFDWVEDAISTINNTYGKVEGFTKLDLKRTSTTLPSGVIVRIDYVNYYDRPDHF